MSADNSFDSTIIAKLPPAPHTAVELKSILAVVATWSRDNVMLDLSEVDTLCRPAIYNLLQLHRVVTRQGRRLSLANVAPSTKQKIIMSGGKSLFTLLDQCVASFQPSSEASTEGRLMLVGCDRTRRPERRQYVRFDILGALPIEVRLHGADAGEPDSACDVTLVDVSQGGVGVAVSPWPEAVFELDKTLRLEIRSDALDIEAIVSAKIRTITPTADGAHLSLGLQFTGVESEIATRELVRRLCDVQGRYLRTTDAEH